MNLRRPGNYVIKYNCRDSAGLQAKERKRTGNAMAGWYHAKEMDAKREISIGLVNEKGYHNPNMLDCYTCHY